MVLVHKQSPVNLFFFLAGRDGWDSSASGKRLRIHKPTSNTSKLGLVWHPSSNSIVQSIIPTFIHSFKYSFIHEPTRASNCLRHLSQLSGVHLAALFSRSTSAEAPGQGSRDWVTPLLGKKIGRIGVVGCVGGGVNGGMLGWKNEWRNGGLNHWIKDGCPARWTEDVLDVGLWGCQPAGQWETDGEPGWDPTATDFQSRCLNIDVCKCISW